jgi:hypothetical protein
VNPRAFYESDCQERTSSPLTACRFCCWQSAPSFRRRRPCCSFGQAVLSSSASFLSSEHRSVWTLSKRAGRTTRTMVLSETRHTAGLTLLRVLREGLWLDTCLGVTMAGRNALAETASRTVVRNLEPRRGNVTRTAASRLLAMSSSPSVSQDRRVLLFSRAAA